MLDNMDWESSALTTRLRRLNALTRSFFVGDSNERLINMLKDKN